MVTQKKPGATGQQGDAPDIRDMIRATWYTLCDRSGNDWYLLIFD